MGSKAKSSWLQYGGAIGFVVIATAVRMLIEPILEGRQTFITFYLAVMASSWLGGLRPAIVAVGLSILCADYFFIGSPYSFIAGELDDYLSMGLFFVVGLSIALLNESQRRAQHRAEASTQEAVQKQRDLEQEIVERKRAEAQLTESHHQMRVLAARLDAVREEESARIALDIHDDLGQLLTGLKVELSWVQNRLSLLTDDEVVLLLREKLPALVDLANATIESVQRIASGLRPVIVGDQGVIGAIEWLSLDFENRTGIKCRCVYEIDDKLKLDDVCNVAVFRVAQEALTNVMRHAHATLVIITMQHDAESFTVQIADNGRGIAEDKIRARTSIGLLGMRERAVLVGGTLTVSGVRDRGTTVVLRIPLSSCQDQAVSEDRSGP